MNSERFVAGVILGAGKPASQSLSFVWFMCIGVTFSGHCVFQESWLWRNIYGAARETLQDRFLLYGRSRGEGGVQGWFATSSWCGGSLVSARSTRLEASHDGLNIRLVFHLEVNDPRQRCSVGLVGGLSSGECLLSASV